MPDFVPVSEHILRLELPFRILGPIRVPVAVWLVRSDQGWTLIDSGPPDVSDHMISAVVRATHGRGPDRILLTHAHYDHAGGLTAVRQAWNPPLMCHREEVPFVAGELDYRHLPTTSLMAKVGRYLMRAGAWQVPVAKDLERGQPADGMAVIHLPGHAPGQVGFLHPTDRAMICGDAVMSLGGRLSPPSPLSTPDPATAAASMRRLGELDFDHLLPSHGVPILGQGRQAMLDFLARRGLG